jgi:hypothetical protein
VAGRGLAERLVSSGALRREAVQMARRRQQVYGGGLDTVLLEMGLVDEGTLWALLVEETGLQPLPPSLLEWPIVEPELLFDLPTARRLGVFAFESPQVGSLQLQAVARPNFDHAGISDALAGRPVELFVVPEVRFEALLGSFYAQAIPPRFVSLLGRLMGAEQLRRWSALRAPRHRLPTPPVDVGPRYLPTTPPAVSIEAIKLNEVVTEAQEPIVPQTAALQQPTSPSAFVESPLDIPVTPPVAKVEEVTEDKNQLRVLEIIPREKVERDDLLSALSWFADLQGGPRAAAVSEAICERWTASEIFPRLVSLARRGENVAASILPLLAKVENIEFLEQQLVSGPTRDRVWAATALGNCLQQVGQGQANRNGTESTLFHSDSTAAARISMRLCERVERDHEPDLRAAAARGLRGLYFRDEVNALISRLSHVVADPSAPDASRVGAAIVLGDMRAESDDGLQGLIAGTGAKQQTIANTCHAALFRITGNNPGQGPAKWRKWWKAHGSFKRAAWLVGALADRRPEVRLAASTELAELTGMSLGYHFDLTPGPRRASIERWKQWLMQGPP